MGPEGTSYECGERDQADDSREQNIVPTCVWEQILVRRLIAEAEGLCTGSALPSFNMWITLKKDSEK
jgi:hypothetical protein